MYARPFDASVAPLRPSMLRAHEAQQGHTHLALFIFLLNERSLSRWQTCHFLRPEPYDIYRIAKDYVGQDDTYSLYIMWGQHR